MPDSWQLPAGVTKLSRTAILGHRLTGRIPGQLNTSDTATLNHSEGLRGTYVSIYCSTNLRESLHQFHLTAASHSINGNRGPRS